MKKFIGIIILIINLAATALYIRGMKDTLYPIHYGIDSQPDRYGDKWWLLLPAAIAVAVMICHCIYGFCTKNNENISKNKQYENIAIIFIFALIAVISWVMLLSADGVMGNWISLLPCIIMVLFGVLFIAMGNYMGKLKQNRYFGVKTRATLNNVTVWRKAHRLSGILGIIGGLLMIAAGVVTAFTADASSMMIILCAVLLVAICLFGVIPTIYAARLYKKLGDDGESVGWYGTDEKKA